MIKKEVYKKSDHSLPLTEVDPDAIYVTEKLKAAGHMAYIVGGSVRDLLLGVPPKDFDISTSAKPEEVKQLFRSAILIGKRFRLAHIRFGKKILEVSTFRTGSNESDALIVRDNEWGTPEEDALRRDFTINSLFYDPAEEIVIDYVGGFADLQKKTLRTIGHPFLRFKQDPVRMIRLLKFQARFGFSVDPETKIALLECRSEIMKSSQARILEELLRMLESNSSNPFFRLLSEHGMLELLSPGLGKSLSSSSGEETLTFLEEIDKLQLKENPVDRSVLLAPLVFPVLKNHLKNLFIDCGKIPHMGEILEETIRVVDSLFRPFFVLPRKLKVSLVSILTTQFRLTPYDPKKSRIRLPQNPEMPLAIAFLKLRSLIEPALQISWKEIENLVASGGSRPRRSRRRRRS